MKLASLVLLVGPATAAPLFQTQVEILRASGMLEVPKAQGFRSKELFADGVTLQRDILAHLHANHPTPAYTGTPLYRETETSTVYDFIDRDTEGDISPGSVTCFHYADERLMNRIFGSVKDFFGCDTRANSHGEKGKGRPAWQFVWMGDAWRSAASKVPRLR
jgi:hypothetical protein